MYVTLPLSYRKDKRVWIGPLGKEEPVPIAVLGERARQALVSRQTKQVFLRMDAGVTAGASGAMGLRAAIAHAGG